MNPRQILQYGVLSFLLALGVWLIARPAQVQPETQARFTAVRSMAPYGVSTAGAAAQADSLEPILPVVVNLGDIPANVYDPNNLYDRWLRGEADLDENEHRVSAQEVARLQQEALSLPPSAAVQIAESGPGLRAPVLGVSFDSLDRADCCGGGSVVPPDPIMAAGPNHLIAIVNLAFEIYDKTSTSLAGPTTMASFFASVGTGCASNPFDPNVVYDEETDRWIIAADGNGTHYCIAVSQTSDPLGAYNIYSVPAQPVGGEFHDYPHTGVGDSYIVMGANQFGGSIPGGFEGRVWAMDKSVMYAGGALTPVTFSTGGLEGTPQPLHLHGFAQGTWPSLGSTHYFATDPYDGCTVNIWQWNIPAAPNIVSTYDLCTATGVASGMPINFPQSGGSTIQANDFRMREFEYRNGYGWIADSIACNPGGGTVDCVRWHQVDLTGTPALVQAGVYASAGQFRTFPDLAVNQCDDMVIGYTKSSTSMFPSVWYTGRESGDPAGTLQAEAELKAGEITYTAFDTPPHRWGDYTGMTIDPDGVTFWYLGQYSKDITGSARWGNYIGSFTYPDCAPPPTATYCSTPALAIPDNNPAGVTDSLSISDIGEISDLNVYLDVSHTWVGDLIFTLTHQETGTSVTFVDRPGVPASTFGCSGDNIDATLDDEASSPVENECAAATPTIQGSFTPNNPLSAFDTEDLNGTWILTASDLAGGDTGTVNEWCVDVVTVDPNAGTLDGNVTDASTANPIGGASITADDGSSTYNGTTNGSGDYAINLPAGVYTVTASAAGYLPETISGVTIITATTTTVDFALTVAEAVIAVDPGEFVVSQAITTVTTHTLNISNEGTIDLDWTIDEEAPVVAAPGGGDSQRQGVPAPRTTAVNLDRFLGPIVADGSFEAGTPSPFWTEASTNFGSPLCTVAACGTGTGTGPRSGLWWAWFGGISAYEAGSVSQSVIIPSGTATLSFWVEQFVCTGSSNDYLEVNIDGNQVWVTTAADPACGTLGYRQVLVDVSAYANGAAHTLEFNSEVFGGGNTNFFVDDVSIDVSGPPPVCSTLTDIPWVSLDTMGGTTAAGDSSQVMVTFDTAGLMAGNTYTGTLCINSNDLVNPLVTVPLTLTVEAQNPAIAITKTVGTDPGVCAATDTITVDEGTTVYYCYAVTNTGNVPLGLHDLDDSELGSLFTGLAYNLLPGASVDTVAAGLTISATLNVTTTNTATWTAYNAGPINLVTATASATVNVTPVAPPFNYIYLPIILKP
ncbi:MAG: carboxypeptidase regulatory-like domain-containing protein [Anaerolineae bacterium]|nr:carboxypeptidase regulatory-like domain-containing protein [Anaerolineae bacterium]